jgi:hypothetical protein
MLEMAMSAPLAHLLSRESAQKVTPEQLANIFKHPTAKMAAGGTPIDLPPMI